SIFVTVSDVGRAIQSLSTAPAAARSSSELAVDWLAFCMARPHVPAPLPITTASRDLGLSHRKRQDRVWLSVPRGARLSCLRKNPIRGLRRHQRQEPPGRRDLLGPA